GDEDPCTVADVCIEGKCAGVSVPCDCQTNADCAALDDGDVCNGKLICDLADWPYQCSIDPASIKACPAPAAGPNAFCLKASCDPLTGACSLVPDHEGFACSDGNACTTGEHCVAGVCGGAVDLGCLDDNPCTDDSCEPAVGCIYKANSASCSDGNVCTTNDKCTATVCAGGAPLNCDDGSVCNGTETCDSFSGCKAGQPLKCDDGNACNGQEACDPVKGCQAGAPPVCDDLNVCTDDTCDPVKGCAHKANAALCDDGNVCTVGDACLGGLCAPGTALDCDDQNPCTVDSCSSSAGCVHVPLQDGVDCTMPGVCQGACASGQCEEVAMESCDGKDNDCDGVADESGAIGCSTYYKDTDGDGYGSDLKPSLCLCAPDPQSEYTALVAGDCLDQDSAVHPEGTEKCDGKDNDCDGSEDPPKSAGCSKKHKDADSDGWGVGGDHLCVCADFELYTATSVGDCDDGDPEVHFGAAESCNGKDNNCDGLPPPENLPGCFNFHEDADSDSFGKSLVFKCLCEPQWLFKAKEGGDCDDANSFANPSMGEDCDTVFDDDCDGDTNTPDAAHCDAYYLDGDLDGYGSQDGLCLCAPKGSHTSTTGGDCADDDPQVYPSPHAICGIDADCDGSALDPGESCDDGNDKSWDGCTSCKVTELRVNSQTLWGQWGPSVAGLTDGGFAVAWTSNNQDGSYDGIFAQLFLADGSRDGNEFQVNTYTFKSQRNPSVARLAEGGFVVVWEGYAQDTSDSGVFGQMFNADGSASGNEFQVNTYTPGNQVNADVAALGDGGFVVAWESPDGGGKYYGVFCQRFDSGGARAGAEFQADSYMLGDQRAPAVAGLGGGEFVVTWHSMYQDFSGLGVFGQRFSAAGTKLGTEFQVNTQTEKNQGAPSVAPLAGGGFLVAFDGQGTGWSGMRIFRARFYPDGTNQGTDLEVSVYKGSSLTGPRLAPLAGGGAAVVWNSQYQDGAAAGVFGRRLSSIGVPDGAEIQVNTYTVGDQYEPAVASLTDGGFVVAWSSWAQDGSQEGVFAQMFDAGGSKVFPAASQ
ncbi:MAG: hypothetical protein FJ109_18590, partial [Deltaproteobacteria bacterium]|nr:hypothetical protein [Deltaproteobacteria bacterium]